MKTYCIKNHQKEVLKSVNRNGHVYTFQRRARATDSRMMTKDVGAQQGDDRMVSRLERAAQTGEKSPMQLWLSRLPSRTLHLVRKQQRAKSQPSPSSLQTNGPNQQRTPHSSRNKLRLLYEAQRIVFLWKKPTLHCITLVSKTQVASEQNHLSSTRH